MIFPSLYFLIIINEEGDCMERRFDKHNEYAIAALSLSILSLVGSIFSFLNMIPLINTYQFLNKAKDDKLYNIINTIFQIAIFFTFCITILYFTIQI